MPITQIVPHEGGGGWGWDSDAGKWVPVDPQTMQGSLPGNLARAAGRGLEGINLGAQQLVEPNAPDVQAKIKNLQLRTNLASEAAPYTEAFGQALPDLAAGALAAPFTGGMSLGTLATFGGLGAASGLIRPGTMQDRVTNALYGAAAGVAGVGLGEAAMQGVGAAMRVGESIMTKNAASVARGVEVGGQRVQNAADRAAAEAAARPAPDFTVDSQGNAVPGGGEPGINQPGSAGAAATPPEMQGAEHLRANAAADMTDATGANVNAGAAAQAQRSAVEDMGYRSPAWADTRKGSIARFAGGVNERLPWKAMTQQTDMANNQALAGRTVAAAMGHNSDVLTLPEIDAAHQGIQATYEALGREAPDINSQDVANVFKTLQQKAGLFDKGQGQKEIDNAIKNAEAHAGTMPGEQLMQERSTMSDLMAGYYDKPGTRSQGDLMRQAIDRLDNLIAKKAAEQGDTTFGQRFARAREQFQVYQMVRRAGAVSPEGDINPTTLLRTMARDRKSGGFGPGGPQNAGPARQAFDLISVMARDQHGVPPTGVATAAALANMGIKGAAPGIMGATGYGILNTLLGNK